MDYSKHYQQLITKHGSVIKPNDGGYYERHHVIPRSMGGSDREDNLVYLSARAHYVAHHLLWRYHRNKEMAYAFLMMCNQGQDRLCSTSYKEAREAVSAAMSGANNHLYGRTFTKEHRGRISEALRGRTNSPEGNKRRSASMSGKLHHSSKRANVYCKDTGNLVEGGVVLNEWCKKNGYCQAAMSRTANGLRKQHKGVYARYVEDQLP